MLFSVLYFFALPHERGTLIATQSKIQRTHSPDTDTDAGGIGLKPELEPRTGVEVTASSLI